MKKVIVFRDGEAHQATVDSVDDVFRTKDSLVIMEASGVTIEYNWDFVDRFLVMDPDE